MAKTVIPDKYVELGKAIAKLCRGAGLRSISVRMTPGLSELPTWSDDVTVVWNDGRHGEDRDNLMISSQVILHTSLKEGDK